MKKESRWRTLEVVGLLLVGPSALPLEFDALSLHSLARRLDAPLTLLQGRVRRDVAPVKQLWPAQTSHQASQLNERSFVDCLHCSCHCCIHGKQPGAPSDQGSGEQGSGEQGGQHKAGQGMQLCGGVVGWGGWGTARGRQDLFLFFIFIINKKV